MKVTIINEAGNGQHLTVVARDKTTGADGANLSLAPGESVTLDVSDAVQPVLNPGALIDGGTVEPSLFPDAPGTSALATGTSGTPEDPAPIGSAAEVATRTDAAGNPAPVPSFSPGPAPADIAALEAAGIDPAHADPMSSVKIEAGELEPAPATPAIVIATPAGDEFRPATGESGPPTVAGDDQEPPTAGEPLEPSTFAPPADGSGSGPAPATSAESGNAPMENAQPEATLQPGESTVVSPAGEDTPSGGAGEDTTAGADTGTGAETTVPPSGEDSQNGGSADDTLTEATDDQIQDAIRAVARDSDMPEEILKMMDVRLVNAKLKEQGLAPISAQKRDEMQTAMPDSVNP